MKLRCRALARAGRECRAWLGYNPDRELFVEARDEAPKEPDGDVWVQCPVCKKWNRFRLERAVA